MFSKLAVINTTRATAVSCCSFSLHFRMTKCLTYTDCIIRYSINFVKNYFIKYFICLIICVFTVLIPTLNNRQRGHATIGMCSSSSKRTSRFVFFYLSRRNSTNFLNTPYNLKRFTSLILSKVTHYVYRAS